MSSSYETRENLRDANRALRKTINEKNIEILKLRKELEIYMQEQLKQLDSFKQVFNSFQMKIHENAKDKGWHEQEPRNNGELIALCHSELSEALEYLRHDNPKSDHIPEFTGVEEELADVIIRIMDMAQLRGWDIAGAMIAKHEFNRIRSHRHGGKQF
jgi:NTP pyrophosphatase (non-canonical NTP hydrolase)